MLAVVENISPATKRVRRFRERQRLRSERNRRYWPRRKQRLAYAVFVDLMIARRIELGLSQLDLDTIAGFAEGHTAKLENWRSRTGRVAGAKTLPRWIKALWSTPPEDV